MKRTRFALGVLFLSSGLPLLAQSNTLKTSYTGERNQAGNMFNIIASQDLTIDSFDVHFDDTNNPAPCGSTCSVNEVEVYFSWGSYEGKQKVPSAWLKRGNVQHVITTGPGVPQPLQLPLDLKMTQNSDLGFYVTSTGATNSVTGTPNEKMRDTPNAANIIQSGNMIYQAGTSNQYPFLSYSNDRGWNGTIHYTLCTNEPVENYCTAGTSSNGCQALLTTTGAPSASAASGFTVAAGSVEGARSGLVYFGTSGKIAQPWGGTSSFKCVAFPTFRGTLLDSGGTGGSCSGTFSYDLNAHWDRKPTQNPGSGATVQAQLWYRDPDGPNPRTAFSDAIEFTLCP